MNVILRLGGSLSSHPGREREVSLNPGATVGTLLDVAGLGDAIRTPQETPDPKSPPGALIILANGRNIEFLEGLATPLMDGDVVAIFLASDGG